MGLELTVYDAGFDYVMDFYAQEPWSESEWKKGNDTAMAVFELLCFLNIRIT